MKTIKPRIQERSGNLKHNKHKCIYVHVCAHTPRKSPRYIINKLLKLKDNEKNFNIAQEKGLLQ